MNREVDQLYRRYATALRRRALAILGRGGDADDVVHEVFLKAMTHAPELTREASPMTWLYRVTTNACLDRLRVQSRRRELLEVARAARDEASSADLTANLTLAQLLPRVPEEVRAVAIHFYVDEMTQNEIAEHLGVSRRTVGHRLEAFRTHASAMVARLQEEVRP